MFTTLLLNITPLYMNILLGYLAGKLLHMPRDAIARFMFYMISPIIVFNGVIHTQIDLSILSLPMLIFALSSGLSLIFYHWSQRIWKDSTVGLMAFTAGSGNTGYFGLPIAILLFNNQGVGIYLMAILGVTLYENTIGFYLFAKERHTSIECLKKVLKLPTIYAFILALIFNYLNLSMPGVFEDFMCHIKGTYTVLGMMIVGLGIANLPHFKLDLCYVGLSFLAKFVAWPVLILTIIILDKFLFGFYGVEIYQALMLLAIVPLGVNGVILATLMNAHPEKAAAAVLLSILFALIYVPVMIMLFITGSPHFSSPFLCYTVER